MRWLRLLTDQCSAKHLSFAGKRHVCALIRRVVKSMAFASAGLVLVVFSEVSNFGVREAAQFRYAGIGMMLIGGYLAVYAFFGAQRLLTQSARGVGNHDG